MTRYCKQRDNYSCGPVALLNLMKWAAQYPVTYKKSISVLQKACGTDQDGTHDMPMHIQLIKSQIHHNISVIKVKNITLSTFKNHLIKGGSAIVAYEERLGTDEWHYALVIDNKGKAEIINHSNGIKFFTRFTMNYKDLHKKMDKTCDWLITRNSDSIK